MALSEARALALFEILETPYADGFYSMDGMGTLAVSNEISSSTQGQAKTEILAWVLANIEGTAGLLTVLNARLDRWIAIDTKVGRMEGGAAGEVTGLTLNYTEERELIKAKVKNMVPFFKHHEVLARRMGSANGNSGPGAGGVGSFTMIR